MTEKDRGDSSNLELPSQGYFRARESGVSRLSELMFGSLMASYVLGFVSFAASASPNSRGTDLSKGFDSLARSGIAVDYLAISLTFTFITAALYVSYHVGILTMPTTPLDRLSFDFFIALAQACCFGFSLLLRDLFPSFLLLAVLLTLWRQHFESKQLLDVLRGPNHFERIAREAKGRDASSSPIKQQVHQYTKQLDRDILSKIKDHPELVGWQGVQLRSIGTVILLSGIAAVGGLGWFERIWFVQRDPDGLSYVHLIVHVMIAIQTGRFAYTAIKERGTLLVDLVPEKHHPRAAEVPVSSSDIIMNSELSPFDKAAYAFYSEVDDLRTKAETDFKVRIKA